MKILRVQASGVLSYTDLDLQLGRGLTTITGPNGAGKTNIGRLIDLAVLGVRGSARNDWTPLTTEYSKAGHFGVDGYTVRIEVELDRDAVALVDLWAGACLVSSLSRSNSWLGPVRDQALPDSLGSAAVFRRGAIVVERDPARRHPWWVRWEANVDGIDVVYDLNSNTLRRADVAAHAPSPDLASWLKERGDPIAADTPTGAKSTLQFADLLEIGRFDLSAGPIGSDPEPLTSRTLFSTLGLSLNSSMVVVGFARVLDHLLANRFRITTNAEHIESGTVPLAALVANDGESTPTASRLMGYKTGDPRERAAFAAAQELFESLTGRRLDVVQQSIETSPGEHELFAFLVVPTDTSDGRVVDIPLRLAGRGNEEAARLAVQLTEPASVVVLDEPATGLSPVAQRRLLTSLRTAVAERQIILITHSTHLIGVDDPVELGNVVRLTRDSNGATVVHRLPGDAATFKRQQHLLAEVDIRSALFANAVWLVEGPTEQEALLTWLASIEDTTAPSPESAHVVIMPVDGHDNFGKYATLMQALGVPYGVLADGPAFKPGGPLRSMPEQPTVTPTGDDFESHRQAWASVRVRTFADNYHDDGSGKGEFEAMFARADADLWDSIKARGKIRRGATFASQMPVPAEVLEVWRDFLRDVGLIHDRGVQSRV